MDSDDESDFTKEINSLTLQKAVLTFSPDYNPDSYDPSTTLPCSGDDFLKYVMYETSKTQKIVTAKFDERKLNKKNRYEISCNDDSEECWLKTPESRIPTLEWQHDQIKLFNRLRERIAQLKENRDANEAQKANTINWLPINCLKEEPSLLEAVSITQPKLISFLHQLIELVVELNDVSGIPRHIGVWLYTALALLEIPLLPDTCSSLRQLARKCIQLRAALPMEKQKVVENIEPLNLFICLVARYFNQIDLVDKKP